MLGPSVMLSPVTLVTVILLGLNAGEARQFVVSVSAVGLSMKLVLFPSKPLALRALTAMLADALLAVPAPEAVEALANIAGTPDAALAEPAPEATLAPIETEL